MTNLLISSCLPGKACRYDGKAKAEITELCEIKKHCTLWEICPEQDGGLSTPRLPSEIKNGKVYMRDGTDVTKEFTLGAQKALRLAVQKNCVAALLKAKSPSCGKGLIYDGSFSNKLTQGNGITAQLLQNNGIAVYTEDQIDELLEFLKEKQ